MAITFQHLVQAPDGDTKIAGTGIRVYTILGVYEVGETPEYIAEQRDLPIAAVFEALAYGFEHPDEMEAMRRDNEAAGHWALSQLPEELRRQAEQALQEQEQARQEAIRQTREARHGALVL